MTVNSELQSKIEELTNASNDMKNLLDSTQIPTIFLDLSVLSASHRSPPASSI
jgi:two-component system CheB/CheR fusion protein